MTNELPPRPRALADRATWTIVGNSPVSRSYPSRQDFLDTVIGPFNARMSQRLVPPVRALYADGDWLIALFDAHATTRDGKPYDSTYTWYMRIAEVDEVPAIVEAIAFFDTIEFADLWNLSPRFADGRRKLGLSWVAVVSAARPPCHAAITSAMVTILAKPYSMTRKAALCLVAEGVLHVHNDEGGALRVQLFHWLVLSPDSMLVWPLNTARSEDRGLGGKGALGEPAEP